MKKRVLGKTGFEVSEVSLGGLFVSSFAAAQTEANQAVARALELGVNFVDTAPGYANSEEALGIALENVRQPYYLSTKFGGRPQPFNPKDKAALMNSFEESLRLLKRDTIDILMIHEPDRPGQYDWWTQINPLDGPVLEVLEDLKRQKLVKYVGLGGTTAYEIAPIIESGLFDVVLTAFNYSLLWREAEHVVLPAAKKQNMGIIIGSPLQQGALARKHPEVTEGAWWLSKPRREQMLKLYALSDELAMSLPELCLRFVISNPDISTTLSGARSVAEVEQNIGFADKGPLPEDVLKRLGEIAALVPFRPFEERFSMPFGSGYKGPGMAW